MNTNNTATWLKHCIDCGEIRITTESWSINHMKNSKREQRLHKGLYRLQCVLLYHQYSTRLGNTTWQHWQSSIPHYSGKNMEQSAAGSDVITNTVITQIPTKTLFVLLFSYSAQ